MNSKRGGMVEEPEPGLTHAHGYIVVFSIHEESLIKATDLVKGFAVDQHRSRRYSFHVANAIKGRMILAMIEMRKTALTRATATTSEINFSIGVS